MAVALTLVQAGTEKATRDPPVATSSETTQAAAGGLYLNDFGAQGFAGVPDCRDQGMGSNSSRRRPLELSDETPDLQFVLE
jgi:hypothetical protein